MLLTLFVISKSGGLIYQRDLVQLPKLGSNEYLRLGSTFHSLHAIATQVAPILGSEGIERVETATFDLQCFQTRTGTKFFVLATPKSPALDEVLQRIYSLYTDFVLKNPFYEMDMPIRCELFDTHLAKLATSWNGPGVTSYR